MSKSCIIISVVGLSLLLCAGGASGALIHYWDFEGAVNGTVAPLADSANAYMQGAGAAAVPMNATATMSVTSGLGGVGNAVKVSNSLGSFAATGLTSFTSSFTLEEWVRYDGTSGKNWNYFTPRNGSPVTLADYKAPTGTFSAGTAGGSSGTTVWNPTIGTWYFLAVVGDATAGTISLYVTPAGQGATTQLGASGTTYNGTTTAANAFGIGADPGANGYGVAATFDMVALWNTALPKATLDSHYLSGLQLTPVPEPATMGVLAVGGLGVLLRRRRR